MNGITAQAWAFFWLKWRTDIELCDFCAKAIEQEGKFLHQVTPFKRDDLIIIFRATKKKDWQEYRN